MKIHEYQAKEILKKYGVPVPEGRLVLTPEEAQKAAEEYPLCVVKAQVHSGGRGKAGGVKLARNPKEAFDIAERCWACGFTQNRADRKENWSENCW